MKKFFSLLLAGLCLFAVGCTPTRQDLSGWGYDTYLTAAVYGSGTFQPIFDTAVKEGERLLCENGEKAVFAETDGQTFPLSEEMARALRLGLILSEKTDGLYDLTSAALCKLWDVAHRTVPPTEDEIQTALSRTGSSYLSLNGTTLTVEKAGVGIDIGSLGKGYAGDVIAKRLQENGAAGGWVNLGGNVTVFGTKGADLFTVGIRNPISEGEATVGNLKLTDVSVVTTGAYERFFTYENKEYHHLLNPKTGFPQTSDLISVTVVCADGIQADELATAFWLLGAEGAETLAEELKTDEAFLPFETVFVLRDRRILLSEGLRDSFTLTDTGYKLS